MTVQLSATVSFGTALKISAALGKAQAKGLVAAGQLLRDGIKRGLRGGYGSGNFVTGTIQNRVVLAPGDLYGFAQKQVNGDVFVDVGTFGPKRTAPKTVSYTDKNGKRKTVTVPPPGYNYAVAWELGHYNIFLRRRAYMPIWRPTHKRLASAMKAEFDKVAMAEWKRLVR